MLKYITKLAMEIVPSVVATILGAYIVNHYINAKSETPAAAVAAAASTADIKASDSKADGVKADVKPAETSADLSSIPGPGIKAKGISEKAISEKPVSDKAAEKPAEVKPTETASLPVEAPRHSILPKRTAPVAAEAPAVEEHRDAADLARAAIERLRASEGTHQPDPARIPDTPRIVTAAPVSPVRPLPPPVMVSTPFVDGTAPGASMAGGNPPPYTGSIRAGDRLTPPADIPVASETRPLDLRADAESTKDRVNNVAQDMLSAAKSVFHAVLPK
jgi:hypothetical protein